MRSARPTVDRDQLVGHADDACGRNRERDVDHQPLAVALVDDVQRAELPPAVHRSDMKSSAHTVFSAAGASSGWRRRFGSRRFARRGRFSLSAQYTRCTRLWF